MKNKLKKLREANVVVSVAIDTHIYADTDALASDDVQDTKHEYYEFSAVLSASKLRD